MKFLAYAIPALLVLPVVAGAQSTVEFGWIDSIFTSIQNLVQNILIPLVLALALLFFIWGVIQYFILGADDEGKRETGRAYMLYAIIGLVAIVAVWGIVNLFAEILGIGFDTAPAAPGIPS